MTHFIIYKAVAKTKNKLYGVTRSEQAQRWLRSLFAHE